MISDLFDFIFPLPLRWLWFLFYGLVLLKYSYVVLAKHFRIDLMATLHDDESSVQFEYHNCPFDDLIIYISFIYAALVVIVLMIPTPIVPLVIFGSVVGALLLPLNRFGLSSRYTFLEYFSCHVEMVSHSFN